MNLIVDLGNTRIKYAIFDDAGKIVYSGKSLIRYSSYILKRLPSKFTIDQSILCNTSLPDKNLLESLQSFRNFIHFDHNTPIPIINKYGTPETLGKDRLAAAVGCVAKYPNQNIAFIDMGTCITTNFINAQNEFLGGNISPGVYMRLKAMHQFTAKLPLVKAELNNEVIGTSTVKALQNGAVKGALREIDSFIDEMCENFGPTKIILTGGDVIFFENWSKKEIFVAPNLVLEGLNEILKYNVH